MTHYINLKNKPYQDIALHGKTEFTISGEELQHIQVGDELVFSHIEDDKMQIFARVTSRRENTIEFEYQFERNHGFIYTKNNAHLRAFAETEGEKKGFTILLGESGSGKTTFLNSLFYQKNVERYTYEQLREFIVANIKYDKPIPTPECDTVIIEEFNKTFCYLEATREVVCEVLATWQKKQNGDKRHVICSFCCVPKEEIIPFPGDIICVNELDLTEQMVQLLASEKGVGITEEERKELASGRMNELDGKLNVIKQRGYNHDTGENYK